MLFSLPHFSQAWTGLTEASQTLLKKLKSYKTQLIEWFFQLKEAIVLHSHRLWEQAKPKLNKLMQACLAILAAAYTFKMSVQFAPIVLSVVTVLAAAPLFSFVLPPFLFAPSFLLPILLGISLFAGYYKYNELVLRAKLDAQIVADQQEITALKSALASGESALADLRATCEGLQSRVDRLEKALLFSPVLSDGAARSHLPAPHQSPIQPIPDTNHSSLLAAAH